MTNETSRETFALEARAEEIVYLSGDRRVRRGQSDRLEVGSGPAQDIVSGTERARIGGHLSEHTGGNLSTQASRIETTVEGKLTQRFKSDTTLLGGTMTETYTGGVVIGAGMSDDLIIGGGVRVTAPADLWLCGLVGMEEKLGSAYADGALVELYRLAFEREYRTGLHLAGAAVLSGMVHTTTATGFRQYFKVAIGVRDLTPGGDAKESEAPAPTAAPAPAPAPPPGGEAASGGLLMAQGAAGMEDMEDLAALEDIRHLFGDLDTTADSGQTGNRAALLEDLGSLAKHSETGEDVGDAGSLANRLQDGAGLSDVVDAEDLRTVLGLGEGPETVDEARLVPDELVDSRMLDDDGNWVERVCIDPVEIEVRFEHPLGMEKPPPERMKIGQPPPDLEIPVDFDFERAADNFDNLYQQFRDKSAPGAVEMQATQKSVDDMVLTHFQDLPTEWIDDLDLSPDELAGFYPNGSFSTPSDPNGAYLKMSEMEDAARDAGDFAKADYLRAILDNIDAHAYHTFRDATERAEALLGDLMRNVRLPESVDQKALLGVLQQKLAEFDAEYLECTKIMHEELPFEGSLLQHRMTLLDDKKKAYQAVIKAIENGLDPTPYLNEVVASMTANNSGEDAYRVRGILDTQAELKDLFAEPSFGFPAGMGGVQSRYGIEDLDTAARIDGDVSPVPPPHGPSDGSNESTLTGLEDAARERLSEYERLFQDGSVSDFKVSDDAVYFDTPDAALRGQLDIDGSQLSLEDTTEEVEDLTRALENTTRDEVDYPEYVYNPSDRIENIYRHTSTMLGGFGDETEAQHDIRILSELPNKQIRGQIDDRYREIYGQPFWTGADPIPPGKDGVDASGEMARHSSRLEEIEAEVAAIPWPGAFTTVEEAHRQQLEAEMDALMVLRYSLEQGLDPIDTLSEYELFAREQYGVDDVRTIAYLDAREYYESIMDIVTGYLEQLYPAGGPGHHQMNWS